MNGTRTHGNNTLYRGIRMIAAMSICGIVAALVVTATRTGADQYASASPAVTIQYKGVHSENMLLDFCSQLRMVRGITGISYRDYDSAAGSALLTVYYDPKLASPRQIRIFLDHSNILWFPSRSI